MPSQRFRFACLLGEHGAVGELPLLKRLERQRAAESQHQENEHAKGNRATRLLLRRVYPRFDPWSGARRHVQPRERISTHQFWSRNAAKGLTGD